MTINLFDHEELGDIQPLKDILASPIFDRLDLQGQIKYIVNENSRLKAMITDIKDELNARIVQLTAERDDWKADAERLIQLANFNNARAGEYFDLHEQLVKKYEVKE